jgi:hypothetical protein
MPRRFTLFELYEGRTYLRTSHVEALICDLFESSISRNRRRLVRSLPQQTPATVERPIHDSL